MSASPKIPKIIVSGIPRSGTTLVARLIAGLPGGPSWKTRKDVLKIHEPLNEEMAKDLHSRGYTKAMFIFGDVVKSVVSTKLRRFDEGHFRNCGCHKPIEEVDIYNRDDLNYAKIFDTWLRPGNGLTVLAVRSESLYEHNLEICNFVGRAFEFPEWGKRKTNLRHVSNGDLGAIKETYRKLIKKADARPDFEVIN